MEIIKIKEQSINAEESKLYKKMRKFNRLHCDSTVRARFTDSWGRVITLTGTHAFEYTIHIEGIRTVTETFVNGKLARKDLTN